MDDKSVIEGFESAETLAAAIRARGIEITRSAVYEWKRNGIAQRWRRLVAEIAAENGIPVPVGFADPETIRSPEQEHDALSVGEPK